MPSALYSGLYGCGLPWGVRHSMQDRYRCLFLTEPCFNSRLSYHLSWEDESAVFHPGVSSIYGHRASKGRATFALDASVVEIWIQLIVGWAEAGNTPWLYHWIFKEYTVHRKTESISYFMETFRKLKKACTMDLRSSYPLALISKPVWP